MKRIFLPVALLWVLVVASCRPPEAAQVPPTAEPPTESIAATEPVRPPAPTVTSEPTQPPPTPTPEPPKEWAFAMRGEILSSAALAGDTLYFGSYDYNIYAVDAETGEQRWVVETGNQVAASPAVAGGVVYIGSTDGTFYTLDADTGETVWTVDGLPTISSPAVADDAVFFGIINANLDGTGAIVALERTDGAERWRFETNQENISSPIVVDGVVISGAGTEVVALDAFTGEVVWRYETGARIQSSPAVGTGRVIIGNDAGRLVALEQETGAVAWSAPLGAAVIATPWIEGDVVYGASVDGQLQAFDLETGEAGWSFATVGIIGSPRVADGVLYVPSVDGTLFALNAVTGEELWHWASAGPIWSSPLLADGHIFIGSHDRHFYALDASGPRIESVAYEPVYAPQPTPLAGPVGEPDAASDGELLWWNDRVFYEVFVRSFQDSDGDGIGDLQGLISRLDYLNDGDPATTDDLGVTGIWLMPVAESPTYHGYDATDYNTIEQDYGTNEDFRQLMEEAHKRGIAVIVDLVMNHTSSEHPWFLESKRPGSPKESWYIWDTMPPPMVSPWGSGVWHSDILRYFYGIFWAGMPDLNYRNGDVTAAMYDIIRFWLEDMGADGFRLDAVRHLIEDGAVQENTPETHAWLGAFHAYVHTVKPDAMTVGEVWDETAEVLRYIPDELDTAFEFDLAQGILGSVKIGNNASVYKAWRKILDNYPEGQYATFVTNHDQDRVFTQLRRDAGRAKVAASLYLTGPGVPFIYYGEEIGMVGAKPDEDIRRPMAWDDSATGGFTAGEPWEALPRWTDWANVESQAADPQSLLNHYRALVALRNGHPALRTGSMALIEPSVPQIAAYLRWEGDETMLIVINLDDEPIRDYRLALAEGPLPERVSETAVLLGEGTSAPPQPNATGGFDAYTPLDTLPPHSTTVISLK